VLCLPRGGRCAAARSNGRLIHVVKPGDDDVLEQNNAPEVAHTEPIRLGTILNRNFIVPRPHDPPLQLGAVGICREVLLGSDVEFPLFNQFAGFVPIEFIVRSFPVLALGQSAVWVVGAAPGRNEAL